MNYNPFGSKGQTVSATNSSSARIYGLDNQNQYSNTNTRMNGNKDGKNQMQMKNYKIITQEGLIPLTCRMITGCFGKGGKCQKGENEENGEEQETVENGNQKKQEDFKNRQIDGIDLYRGIIVARIEQIDHKINKSILTVTDNTGTIKAVRSLQAPMQPQQAQYSKTSKPSKNQKKPTSTSYTHLEPQPNIYYRMVLAFKEDKQQIAIICQKMEEIKNFMEINWHLLNVINCKLERMNMKK